MDIQTLIDICETELRAGKTAAAAHRLRTLRGKDIPRADLAAVANLCRRAGLDNFSLRLLTPFVRSDKSQMKASPLETAEYAAALQKLGGVREAAALLRTVDPQLVPQADLFLSFCHFRQWEYAEAIPLLERYLTRAPSPYAALVGEMNLAAAFAVAGDFNNAMQTTGLLLGTLESQGYTRLLTNAFELRAQVQISRGDFAAAKESLERGFKTAGSADDGFYLRKWSSLLAAIESNSVAPLASLRNDAVARRDWESVREADFFSLKVNFEDKIFQHLMFGTPHEAYRARVSKDLNKNWEAESYLIGSNDAGKFNLAQSSFEGLQAETPGTLVRNLTAALLHDFYKPWSVCALFAEVFPNEYYNVFTSPNRVHQLMHRTRAWFQENGLPVEISEMTGQFQLRVNGNFAFEVTRAKELPSHHGLLLEKLTKHFQGREFTSQEAQVFLKISSSSYKRLARWAINQNKIKKSGASHATSYRLAA